MNDPVPPPISAELEALLRRMRLPYVRRDAPEVLATAKAQRWEPAEVLRVLLAAEVTGRNAATRALRRKSAGFPSGKTFSSWDEAVSSIAPGTQSGLRSLELSTPPLFPSSLFTEFPTGLRLRFYSMASPSTRDRTPMRSLI